MHDPEDPEVGECAKCGMMQSLDAARIGIVAHLMIKTASGYTCHYVLLAKQFQILLKQMYSRQKLHYISL